MIYLDGKANPEITIPEYKKEGRPTKIKQSQETPQKKEGFWSRLFKPKPKVYRIMTQQEIEEAQKQEDEEFEEEQDEDSDLILGGGW